MLEFWAPGIPAPQGSKKAYVVGRRAVVVNDCARTKPWRDRVASAASAVLDGDPPCAGPVCCTLVFQLARPKDHFGTGRNRTVVRPGAPQWPDRKPDLSKLVRAAEDALKGIVWRDDAQVVTTLAWKMYGLIPGVRVTVIPLTEGPSGLPAEPPA